MAALGIDMSDREPATVHDLLPGRFRLRGQQKPAALIEAEIAAEEAWKKYDQAVDKRIDGLVDQGVVDRLYLEWLAFDATERVERSRWNQSFTLISLPE